MPTPMAGEVHHGGFFVLRCPLLPFDTLTCPSRGLQAPASLEDMDRLEDALQRDRARLRTHLESLVRSPIVREALYVGSPDLEESLDHWLEDPDSDRGRAIEPALTRYVTRMSARPTPFGLFATVAVGAIGEETRLTVSRQSQCRRHTRLDTGYLSQLADALARDAGLGGTLRYRPQSSLHRMGNRWRYVETRFGDRGRSFHLVAVDCTEALDATLARARGGAMRTELEDALVTGGVTKDEARAYVDELIDSQMLVPELTCQLTGVEPLGHLITTLRTHPGGWRLATKLAAIESDLSALDFAGVGRPPATYRHIAQQLESLPVKAEPARLFQVDVIRPGVAASLGDEVMAEIKRGIELLHRLSPVSDDPLHRFREAFRERYGQREIPLLEALDEDSGVGWALDESGASDPSPLLDGLEFETEKPDTVHWGKREAWLLERVGAALAAGDGELALTPHDVDQLAATTPLPLTDAFAVVATVAAHDNEMCAGGDFRVLLHGVTGPSGAELLGRFCHADPELCDKVAQHLRNEEAGDADAVFAEIVHLPEGRLGNILLRPALRTHEIPYLGSSGLDEDRQLAPEDLTLSLSNGGFVLRSSRLNRRVVPRLTSAHNFTHRSIGVYRFLCLLQSEGRAAACHWTWGALASLPFLPRVTAGRIVLATARWRMTAEECRSLTTAPGIERYRAVQEWRAVRKLPRWVVLADMDQTLTIDLDNVLSIDAFVPLLKGRDGTWISELFPPPDEMCATGPEGRFVNEIVVPFTRVHDRPARSGPVSGATTRSAGIDVPRTFPPGSEWMFAKLYAGSATADRVLQEVVAVVSRQLLDTGAIDRWFFVRYQDPHDHLRWRVRVASFDRLNEVRLAVENAASVLVDEGRVHRIAIDTYEREIERYGGPEAIDLAEQLFWADSDAAIDLLSAIGSTGEAAHARWQLAAASVDRLLEDFDLDLDARAELMHGLRERFGRELHVGGSLRRQLAARYRQIREDLITLLEGSVEPDHPMGIALTALAGRSSAVCPVAKSLRALEHEGRLTTPISHIVESHVHMTLNRIFRADHRQHELVIYDFLMQVYRQRQARRMTV